MFHLLCGISLIALLSTAAAEPMDFMEGTWIIENSDGDVVGRSEIVAQVHGTMLYERRTIGDADPQPLWLENAERNNGWTQLFVGPNGQTREFIPRTAPGEWPLVLGADVTLQDGSPARFRMTITRESDRLSRRHLEISRDRGDAWKTVFHYTYRKSPATEN